MKEDNNKIMYNITLSLCLKRRNIFLKTQLAANCCTCFDNCDRLRINHLFTAKCKFRVWPIITVRSAHDRYSVNAIGVIYGVLATLCRHTKCRLRIVSPIAMPLLPFTDKECGNINGPRKRLQCIARNTGFSAS